MISVKRDLVINVCKKCGKNTNDRRHRLESVKIGVFEADSVDPADADIGVTFVDRRAWIP